MDGWNSDGKTAIPEGSRIIANEDGRPLVKVGGYLMPVSDCYVVPKPSGMSPPPPPKG